MVYCSCAWANGNRIHGLACGDITVNTPVSLWVVCPKCGNDSRFTRQNIYRLTDGVRLVYYVCRQCGDRFKIWEEKAICDSHEQPG